MTVSTEDYHIWKFPVFTEEQTDTPGQFCCTDRGLFIMTEETVELHGYTFGKIERYLDPSEIGGTHVVGVFPIISDIFDAM